MNSYTRLLKAGKVKPKDLYFKDEGYIITVIFQTKKAQKLIKKEPDVVNRLYGNGILKFDIDTQSSTQMLVWATSHGLTTDTDGDVTHTINRTINFKFGQSLNVNTKVEIRQTTGNTYMVSKKDEPNIEYIVSKDAVTHTITNK